VVQVIDQLLMYFELIAVDLMSLVTFTKLLLCLASQVAELVLVELVMLLLELYLLIPHHLTEYKVVSMEPFALFKQLLYMEFRLSYSLLSL
jgi:hypothetical protein